MAKKGASVDASSITKMPPPLPPPLPGGPEQTTQQYWGFRPGGLLHFKTKPAIGESEYMPALVNPETFSERVRANYSKGNVLGLSHQSIQYTFTESRSIPMELYISRAILIQKNLTNVDLMGWKKFFQSLLVPSAPGLAPPMVRIIWPGGGIALTGVVESCDVAYEQFSPAGEPIVYTLSIEFLENATRLMTSDRVRVYGIGSAAQGD